MLRYTFTILTLLGCNLILIAQPSKGYEEMSLEELMNINVSSASQANEKLSEAPAMVHLITAQDIQDRGYVTLLDVLEDLPEFEIQYKSHPTVENVIVSRGLVGQNKFIILQNGARISSSVGTLHNVEHNYDVRIADRIEIVMGPASSIYGADAFAGVINIITPDGVDLKGAKLSTGYGSYNTTNSAFQYGIGGKEVSFLIGGSFYRSDEPFLPKYYPTEYAWYNSIYSQTGILRKSPYSDPSNIVSTGQPLPWNMTKIGQTVMLKFNYKDFELGFSQGGTLFSSATSIKPEYTIYGEDQKYGSSIRMYYARYKYKSFNEKFTAEHIGSGTFYELNPNSLYTDNFTGYQKGYHYAFNNGIFFNGVYSFIFNKRNKINFGYSVKHIDVLPETADLDSKFNTKLPARDQDFYYVGTNVDDIYGNNLRVPQKFYYYTGINYGLFGQYQGNIKNKLFYTIGSRIDYDSRTKLTVNPRLGLIYNPKKTLSFAFNYGEAFLNPSPDDQYAQFGEFGLNRFGTALESAFSFLANPNLKPQKVRSIDISNKVIFGKLAFGADIYYNYLSDLIGSELISNTEFQGIPVLQGQRNINNGTAKTYGGSLKLDYRQKIGAGNFNAYLYYSYSNGSSLAAGVDNDLHLSSLHNIKAGINFKWKKLTTSFRALYRSGTEPAFDGINNVGNAPAYVMLNFYGQYRIIDPTFGKENNRKRFTIDAFLRIRNLTDARYYNSSADAAGNNMSYSPQDPIRIMFGVILGVGKIK